MSTWTVRARWDEGPVTRRSMANINWNNNIETFSDIKRYKFLRKVVYFNCPVIGQSFPRNASVSSWEDLGAVTRSVLWHWTALGVQQTECWFPAVSQQLHWEMCLLNQRQVRPGTGSAIPFISMESNAMEIYRSFTFFDLIELLNPFNCFQAFSSAFAF